MIAIKKHFCALNLATLALCTFSGCADVSEELNSDPTDRTEPEQFAPRVVGPLKEKTQVNSSLSGKGASSNIPFGYTYVEAVTVPPGATITYRTSQPPNKTTVDTVIAIFHRDDNRSYLINENEYEDRKDLDTLAWDDDSAGNLYSVTSWTNTLSETRNVFVMVFGWGTSTGQVYLSANGGTPKLINVLAGSVDLTTNGADFFGTSNSLALTGKTVDPWLFVFQKDKIYGRGWDSAYNDDSNGTRESRVGMFYVQQSYFIVAHSAAPISQGFTTILY
jgi:hypothetical protein